MCTGFDTVSLPPTTLIVARDEIHDCYGSKLPTPARHLIQDCIQDLHQEPITTCELAANLAN